MKKFIFTLLILLLCSFECKAEVYKILNFEEESLPIINENFRRLGAKALRVDHLERHTEFESLIDGQMKDHDQDTIVSVETITLLNDGKYAYSDDDTIRFTTAGTEQINITDGYVSPTTNADIDFGISTKRFSDIWLSDTIRLGNDGDDVTLDYDTTDNQLDINQDVNIEKATPEIRLTDSADNEYGRLTRTDTSQKMTLYNRTKSVGLGAIDFDASSRVGIPYNNIGQNITYAVWIKSNSIHAHYIMSFMNTALEVYTPGNATGWIYFHEENGIATEVVENLTLFTGTWYRIVVTFDSNKNYNFYLNGSNIKSGVGYQAISTSNYSNTIGDLKTLVPAFEGIIDEVIIFSAIKDQAWVTADYNSGAGRHTPNTDSGIEYIYHLDDGTGTIATDSSGNSRNSIWWDGLMVWTADAKVINPGAGSVGEITILESKNTDVLGETGINIYGDTGARLTLEGVSLRMNVAGTEQLRIDDGSIHGTINNDIDLGTAALQYKNIYVDGLAYIDGFGEDTDMGDFDITSIDKLEGFDAGIYIDMGADSIMDIAADGNINIITPLIKINNANIEFEGTVDEFETTLVFTNPTTVNKTITFQNASGIVATDTVACSDLDGDALTITTGVLNFDGGDTPGGELGGTWASPTVDTVHSGSAHHNPITLDVNADTVLSLSTQEVGLDTQVANYVFVGPVSGVAAIPTFRAIVDADIPDNITITEVDPTVDTVAEIMAIIDNEALNFGTGVLTAAGFVGPLTGNVTGNATTVTNATLTTALTVNTGTVTLTGNVANTSALTIGAGAVSVSGSNTGDNAGVTSVTGTSPIASSGGVTPDISIPAATNAAAGHATAAHIAAIEANTAKVTNATHTGDATGATALTVVGINGTLMSGLATGILKNTTTTGVPSIAIAADFPTLNQNTTGNATTATTATHLAGGSGGTIPYQSAAGTTAMLANGTAGQVLQSNGTTLAPSWVAAGGGGLVAADIDTSAELAAIVTDETGTGALCFATAPTFTTSITTPIINLTGGQIAFPATAVPSANANTLDDYEEGTWTSGLQFGKAAVGITYSNRLATYVKIGKLVVVKCWILLSSKGTSTGSATVEGLPFVSVAAFPINVFIYDGVSFVGHVSGFIPSGSTSLNFREITEAGSGTNLDNVDFSNTSDFQIFAAYEI